MHACFGFCAWPRIAKEVDGASATFQEVAAPRTWKSMVSASPDFPDCAGVPRHKIRGESSSNGSEIAECCFTSQKSELSARQMAPSGVIAHQRGRRALELMEAGSLRAGGSELSARKCTLGTIESSLFGKKRTSFLQA